MEWEILYVEDTIALDETGRPRKVRRVYCRSLWGDSFYVDVPVRHFSAEYVRKLIEAEWEQIKALRAAVYGE